MSYSTDLRERIVDTVLNKGMTLQKTAETFNVSKSSVERYLHRYRQQGDVTPQTSPGRPSALNEHRSWVEQHLINNDLTPRSALRPSVRDDRHPHQPRHYVPLGTENGIDEKKRRSTPVNRIQKPGGGS